MTQYYKDIIQYYTECQTDYELIWHLKTHNCMHYGYWSKGITKLRDALNAMTCLVSQTGAIKAGEKVLDMGCGVGGPAVYLAKSVNCFVHGISISEEQINQANELARKNELSKQVLFTVNDYLRTGFESNSFDVIYAIESSCYAVSKEVFLEEAFRLLKPKGRLIVLDFFWRRKPLKVNEQKLMKNWTDSWAICDFEYENKFLSFLKTTGFFKIKQTIINENVFPSIKRLYYCYFPGLIIDTLLRFFGHRSNTLKKNMHSSKYQFKAFKKELWNYNLFYAEKP